ncbi:hypothetical protein JRB05_004652 [Escherichia coli O124]|nr:hypothetical protein [Escherichia coli O124]
MFSTSHVISKKCTQRIERHNLNLRTHLKRLTRKTICFSKSEDMHGIDLVSDNQPLPLNLRHDLVLKLIYNIMKIIYL